MISRCQVDQPGAERAGQRAERDEDDGEAEHEQQRPGEHPAAPRVLEVGAGQAGGVGEVARQQRDHARREERHQPGDQRDRDREQQRARTPAVLGEPVTHPRSRLRGHVLDDARPASCVDGSSPRIAGRDPALGVEHHEARDRVRGQGAREGEHRLAVGRVERRVRDVVVSGRSACAWSARGVADVDADELRPSSPSSSAASTTSGASARHGAHHEPQTTTTTGLPRKSARSSGSPSRSSPVELDRLARGRRRRDLRDAGRRR